MDRTLSELRALIVSCTVRRAGAKPGQSPPLPQKCTAYVSKSCSECHSFSWFSITILGDEEALLCKSHWAPSKRQTRSRSKTGLSIMSGACLTGLPPPPYCGTALTRFVRLTGIKSPHSLHSSVTIASFNTNQVLNLLTLQILIVYFRKNSNQMVYSNMGDLD